MLINKVFSLCKDQQWGCRKRMHDIWQRIWNFQFTKQRLCDQKSRSVTKHYSWHWNVICMVKSGASYSYTAQARAEGPTTTGSLTWQSTRDHATQEINQQLPRLKNDRSVKRLVKNVEATIKVDSAGEPGLITIKQLQYTGANLINTKISPRKLEANRIPGGCWVWEWK